MAFQIGGFAPTCAKHVQLLHSPSCKCTHIQVNGRRSRSSREADLVELDSPPDCLRKAHSQGPHLLGQSPRLPLKVLGNVLSSRLQLLLIELLGQWLSVVLNLHSSKICCKALWGRKVEKTHAAKRILLRWCVHLLVPACTSVYPLHLCLGNLECNGTYSGQHMILFAWKRKQPLGNYPITQHDVACSAKAVVAARPF